MSITHNKVSILSATFGALSIGLVFFGELLKRDFLMLWLARPLNSTDLHNSEVSGPVTVGPPSLLSVYDERFVMAMFIGSVAIGLIATALGIYRVTHKDRGHWAAVGVVLGLSSTIWVAKFIVYGV